MILALDPGISGCGVALFRDHVLQRADYVRNTLTSKDDDLERCVSMGAAVSRWYQLVRSGLLPDPNPLELVAEWPRVYEAGKAKKGADPNDLLLLAGVDAATALALGCRARKVEPREHKGTMRDLTQPDGTVVYLVAERAKEELSVAERTRVNLPSVESLAHNVWDSVCVGLHAVGRSLVDTRRVIAR